MGIRIRGEATTPAQRGGRPTKPQSTGARGAVGKETTSKGRGRGSNNNEDDARRDGAAVTRKKNEKDKDEGRQLGDFLFVPSEDLTCHNFEKHNASMTDRQFFSLAYKTETKIRFQKLKSRGRGKKGGTAEEKSTSTTTTLESEYLIDIYPATTRLSKSSNVIGNNDGAKLLLERDLLLFQRKAAASLSEFKRQDSSLTPIGVDKRLHGKKKKSMLHPAADSATTSESTKPVPPNYLYFLTCLECYTGYKVLGLCNADDTSIPRLGIMGGAVVAALSSWSDVIIIRLFKPLEKILLSSLDQRGKKRDGDGNEKDNTTNLARAYSEAKELLIKNLNNHFLSPEKPKTGRNNKPKPGVRQPRSETMSAYEDGDVDFFLSASPLTQSLIDKKHVAISHPLVNEFLGGCGLCHGDLYRFAERILQRLNAKCEETGQFVHALTKNGLSFMFAPYHDHFFYDAKIDRILELIWPRSTQLIMLDPQADLLGALMDFDLSVATCAFDGTTVRAAPRAALSLTRKLVVVTRFCFEEKRNRKRIVKCTKRGFKAMVLDPNCRQQTPGPMESLQIKASKSPTEKQLLAGGKWYSRQFRTEEDYDKIIRLQTESMGNGEGTVYCCCPKPSGLVYTMALFENSPNDATEFFKNMYDWDEVKVQEVHEVPPHLRIACKFCREQYGLSQFLKEEYPVDEFEDMLHGMKTLWKSLSSGYKGDLEPSFYGGAAFNSKLVRNDSRSDIKAQSMLHSQSRAEMLRFMIKHNTLKGYKQRFTFTRVISKYGLEKRENPLGPLQDVFDDASKLTFPESGRPPVGLNPERFIAKCKECKDWLHGVRNYSLQELHEYEASCDLACWEQNGVQSAVVASEEEGPSYSFSSIFLATTVLFCFVNSSRQRIDRSTNLDSTGFVSSRLVSTLRLPRGTELEGNERKGYKRRKTKDSLHSSVRKIVLWLLILKYFFYYYVY